MKSFDTRTYGVSDFAEWQSSGLLILSPEFQRRAVWTGKAKSYLIDTVLRGKPMPKVLITQGLIDGRNVRTVIDGQQRLRAILEFMAGGFTVLRTHNQEYSGKTFEELPDVVKEDYWKYEIGVDVLFESELSELLDIFARLNTYSVKLNSTELLNATFLGSFKTMCHSLGHKYARYWLESKVLTNAQVARMAEVELTADLLGALIEGISSKKQIPNFYRKFDDADIEVEEAAKLFERIMSFMGEVYSPADLSITNFRRVHFFYSAFLSVSNSLLGFPTIKILNSEESQAISVSRTRVVLDGISADFDRFTEDRDQAGPSSSRYRILY